MSYLPACEDLGGFWERVPVLGLRLETDAVPFGSVTLPLSLVLLPQTAGQLGSQHHILALLQDGTHGHCVCCRKTWRLGGAVK